jgi:hypothetical protein
LRFSLRLRWFGTAQAIAGCLVVIGVSSAAGRAALHRVATVAAERRVGAVARALSSRLARLPARRRLDLVRRAGRAKGLVVALTDPRGRVTRGTERPPVSDARLQDWLVQESGRDGRSVYRAVTLPSPLQDTALVVATRIGQPSDAVSRLDRALAVVAAFVLLLGILAAHAVWDDVAGGVVDLTARVRSMTAGTAAGVVPIGSLDEAGDLSRAVNRQGRQDIQDERRGAARPKLRSGARCSGTARALARARTRAVATPPSGCDRGPVLMTTTTRKCTSFDVGLEDETQQVRGGAAAVLRPRTQEEALRTNVEGTASVPRTALDFPHRDGYVP